MLDTFSYCDVVTENEFILISLTDWAAVISAMAGISAAIFILLQLRHMEQHRNMEISISPLRGQKVMYSGKLFVGLGGFNSMTTRNIWLRTRLASRLMNILLK